MSDLRSVELPRFFACAFASRVANKAELADPLHGEPPGQMNPRRRVHENEQRRRSGFSITTSPSLTACRTAGAAGWIDSDDAGWGCDPQSSRGLLSTLADDRNYLVLRRPFLVRYRPIRPIPTDPEDDLWLIVALRRVTSIRWPMGRHRAGAIDEERFRQILHYRTEQLDTSVAAIGD